MFKELPNKSLSLSLSLSCAEQNGGKLSTAHELSMGLSKHTYAKEGFFIFNVAVVKLPLAPVISFSR